MNIPSSIKRFVLGAFYTYALAYGLTWVLTAIMLIPQSVAYAVVQVVIFIVNFIVAKKWVFPDAASAVEYQLSGFICVAAICRTIDWLIFSLIVWTLPNNPLGVSVFIAMSLVFPFKYFLYRYMVFHR